MFRDVSMEWDDVSIFLRMERSPMIFMSLFYLFSIMIELFVLALNERQDKLEHDYLFPDFTRKVGKI